MTFSRTTTLTQTVHSFEELRSLITQYNAWNMTLTEFIQAHGRVVQGTSTTITHYVWGGEGSLNEKWELLKYIHRHYQSK